MLYIFTDGQHKLIRWRFVVHGAIDGYSRNVLFIKCSTNNTAETVYKHFREAVGHYGLPSRIRIDRGGENVLVANHMLRFRGIERRSVLVGSSVHNQRIERLWRDSHRCSTSVFYQLFYFLEDHDLLNPLDEEQMFALHYVYLPKINKSLAIFCGTWNNHGLRTENGKTPRQLFTSGVLRLRHSGLTALDFFNTVPEHYGTGGEDIAVQPDNNEVVSVPVSAIQPNEEQLEELRRNVNPYDNTNDYGIEQYIQALDIIKSWSVM